MDIILDTALFPSLPGAGGKVSHTALMGRNTRQTGDDTVMPRLVFPAGGISVGDTVHVGHKRSNSFGASGGGLAVGNRAGVGAGIKDTVLPQIILPRNQRGTGAGGDDRVVRRTASFEDRTPTHKDSLVDSSQPLPRKVPKSKKHLGTSRKGHTRTASDSTIISGPALHGNKPLPCVPGRGGKKQASPQTPLSRSLAAPRTDSHHTRPASLDPSVLSMSAAITLGTSSTAPTVSRVVSQLHALIPPSRLSSPSVPSSVLLPHSLLIPLTLVLEALVLERSNLRGQPAPSLPLLPSGTSLTLPHDPSLDWTVVAMYLRTLHGCLDDLLPLLRSAPEQERVAELVSTIRTYVAKAKKVFGEVAGMYVDGYGFVRGWWDEGAMKECAGVVGKWGDMFDA